MTLDAPTPQVVGYSASGYQLFTTWATMGYPQQHMAEDGTLPLQRRQLVTWTATTSVLPSDWTRTRSIESSPVAPSDSDWAAPIVADGCAGPERDYASRAFLQR